MRANHAGESGAVEIYRGVLAATRDAGVRAFAERHMQTESGHLREIEALLPIEARSRLLPVWRVSGWLLGALPALLGPRAVYATVDAVESFVDGHYSRQIDALQGLPALADVREVLRKCHADELEHRDEARSAGSGNATPVASAWAWLINLSSEGAVFAAKRV